MAREFNGFKNFRATGDEQRDVELLAEMVSRELQELYKVVPEISIGEKGATIGTVGTTALYLRTLTVDNKTVTMVTSD